MACFTVLRICVCAVLLCLVFVNDIDAKKGLSFGWRKSGGGSSRRTGQQQHKPPPPQHTENTHFLDAERNRRPQTNTGPIGFQPSGGKPQTNTAPIGFEHFQNPGSKVQTPIGFESFNKKSNSPSAPAIPVPPQNIPNAPAMPNTNIGFNQPVGGTSFSSNQYPGKVNNPYQTNPNHAWDTHSNPQFKPSNNYPNTGYQNPGYPNSGYPNSGFSNPSQPFGNNYYNPNTGYPSFPNNYFGGSHYSAPNSFGNSHFGNSYNPYGNNYFPGGGYGHSGFGGSGGYGGYPGQFGYNNYKPKSKFGFGGLPLPIPIPIPIPLGGFGSWGLGSRRSENNYSHHVLNSVLNTTNLNNTSNATSIYVVNNVTVVSCTNELFSYGPVNLTVTTCTADNCTSVKVYMANNSAVNRSVLTMCLGPNVTVTSNSSDGVKLEVSNVSSYWQMICAVPTNITLNSTASNSTIQNATEKTVTTTEASQSIFLNGTSNVAANSSSNKNSTERLCEILNCSYVEMCLPETAMDNNTKKGYRPCVRVKMCKSPSTPIVHDVTLNTTVIRYEEFDNIINRTESYMLNNITVLAFYPIANNCSGNDTSCLTSMQPVTNVTDSGQTSNNSTVNTCTAIDGISTSCNSSVPRTDTANNTSGISPELIKTLESEVNKYNTSLSSLLQYLSNKNS